MLESGIESKNMLYTYDCGTFRSNLTVYPLGHKAAVVAPSNYVNLLHDERRLKIYIEPFECGG